MRILVLLLILSQVVMARPRNVVFILSDDHRYDFMSFMEEAPDFLETPHLDRMAAKGAHLANAFVTTSLCSPSRASILTGRYAHNHQVVDNTSPIPEGTVFFPTYLKSQGYRTAFMGKWHMGESDDRPQPGFDRWISFRGQGVYYNPEFSFDGKRRKVTGYVTDLLTDYAIDWLRESKKQDQPFFLVLSHKAVHAEFEPAPRHQGRYADIEIPYPASKENTEDNYEGKPHWVKEQRYGWHGVDYAYQGQLSLDQVYRRYSESLLALDESVGRVLDYLDREGLAQDTLVIYMGDNGFLLGEHGLIDKRQAYEESMRVPMLAYAPGFIPAGRRIEGLVRNIDIAPTVMELAGLAVPPQMDGRSFLSLLTGQGGTEDREFLYEYYWEDAFPHTPTVFALRNDQFKYIYYHGIWDKDELYDLKSDPKEMHNLIRVPAFKKTRDQMRKRLWQRLQATGGMQIPLKKPSFWRADQRKMDR